jgi:hypothetical protein
LAQISLEAPLATFFRVMRKYPVLTRLDIFQLILALLPLYRAALLGLVIVVRGAEVDRTEARTT